jgi:hypothetical protein
MPVVVREYEMELADMTTGISPITGDDPYDPSVVFGPDNPSFPSNNWHWTVGLPAISAEWITVFSSVTLLSTGPSLQIGVSTTLLVACSFDDGPKSGQSVVPNVVTTATPSTFESFFWVLFDNTQNLWEEFWLTQAMIDVGSTARSGPGYGWLDPKWKAQMGNNVGNLTYYVPPFPRKFDFWFTAPSFWRPTTGTADIAPYAPALYTIEDQRVIIIACTGAEILMSIV